MALAEGWEIAALRVGTAYAVAAQRHREALEGRTKEIELDNAIMFSVMTVATAGGLSWISTVNQLQKGAVGIAVLEFSESDLLTNILEDAMQSGAGEVFSSLGPYLPKPDTSAVSIDPLIFQNDRVIVVKLAKQRALVMFEKYASALVHNRVNQKWDRYEESAQRDHYERWLKSASGLLGATDLPPVGQMADELERGFWAKWAPKLRLKNTYAIVPQSHWTKIGDAVRKRLKALGIAEPLGLGLSDGWFYEDDSKKLIEWGNGYEVKQFVTMR